MGGSRREGERGKAPTVSLYSFPVPSKHNISVRDFFSRGAMGAGAEEEGSVDIAAELG